MNYCTKFSDWQLLANHAAISTEYCCRNNSDSELLP